jgi:hypothetical protein
MTSAESISLRRRSVALVGAIARDGVAEKNVKGTTTPANDDQ